MDKYASHEMFKADNLPAWKLRQQSVHEAMADAEKWLQEGNSIAVSSDIMTIIKISFCPINFSVINRF